MTHPPPLSDRDAKLAAALAALDMYGGDDSRWPIGARRSASALAGDATFEAARREALALDAMLDIEAPRASEALLGRILLHAPARPPATPRFSLSTALAALAPARILPVGAVAGLSALGFAAGILTAPIGAAAQDEALVYAEAALTSAFGDEELFWENGQ